MQVKLQVPMLQYPQSVSKGREGDVERESERGRETDHALSDSLMCTNFSFPFDWHNGTVRCYYTN